MKRNGIAVPFPRFVVRVRWHTRKAGGLFLGLRVGFPTSILFDNGEVRPTWQVNVGLLVATVNMEFRGRVTSKHNTVPRNCPAFCCVPDVSPPARQQSG